jgi:hypothetical protein
LATGLPDRDISRSINPAVWHWLGSDFTPRRHDPGSRAISSHHVAMPAIAKSQASRPQFDLKDGALGGLAGMKRRSKTVTGSN